MVCTVSGRCALGLTFGWRRGALMSRHNAGHMVEGISRYGMHLSSGQAPPFPPAGGIHSVWPMRSALGLTFAGGAYRRPSRRNAGRAGISAAT